MESNEKDETIIINPSKVMKEIYSEPLVGNGKKDGAFKRFILYMGNKIFINE